MSSNPTGIAPEPTPLDYTVEEFPACKKSNGNGAASINAGATGTGAGAARTAHQSAFALSPWPVMEPAAYHGLAGEVVATIAPQTEADPAALLVNYLTYFGNVIGRVPFCMLGEDHHYPNLYGVLVGETSSRKGTSASRVTAIFRPIDPDWVHRKTGGMSSGEGLLHEIRDPVYVRKKGAIELSDPGVADKRQMVEEAEFARVLAVMQRDGSTLSDMIRYAWDCHVLLKSKVRNSPLAVTNPFISIIAHITPDELRQKLDTLAHYNGFTNRFLFVCVKRSKEVPNEGPLDPAALAPLAQRTREAIEAARLVGRLRRTEAAQALWDAGYSELSAKPPGLLGAATARAEAQVARLSLVYALLDRAPAIDAEHLTAALALWRYCADSARHVFGPVVSEHDHAAVVLRNLRRAGTDGMTMREIHDLFSRHLGADKLHAILDGLAQSGAARCERKKPAGGLGRPREIWLAI